MRAVLRYRRIPHRFIIRGGREDRDTPDVPVALIPVLVLPGEGGEPDTAMVDSTPQIRKLEALWTERSIIPPDPALAFIDALLEDYADEWLTKAMFHYRWTYPADIRKAGAILPLWRRIDAPDDALAEFSRGICERQIERLWVVGSNETTRPVIEESYRRLLLLFDAHLHNLPFLLGHRPASSDFGLFGQLSQLALFDPTPAAIALEESPRVIAWCQLIEDLSGLAPSQNDWTPRDALPETLRGILVELGRVYVPFLLANARALDRGDSQVECEIDGRKWTQKSFPYQRKCLQWLRDGYAALGADDCKVVDSILEGTGCEALFSGI
jgi:glutathione S-transferase